MVDNARKRAAIYVRISGQSDDRRYSLETQAEACLAKAHELGYESDQGDVFEDRWTGTELCRPELTRMRDQVRLGQYQAIVFYSPDRLSRNQAHVYILLDECERHGVILEGISDSIDSSPMGKLILSIKAFVAEIEREKIRDRCERGKNRKLSEGKILGSGSPRFGFVIDEHGHYVRCSETGPVVELIFKLVGVDGLSLRDTVNYLLKKGIKPPGSRRKNGHGQGVLWTRSTLSRMVREEAYIGNLFWGKTRSNGKRKNGRLLQNMSAREDWVTLPEGTVEPFIDRDIFDAANRRVDGRSQDMTRNKGVPQLLRGRMFCKVCGLKMSPRSTRCPTTRSVHRYYVCGGKTAERFENKGVSRCDSKNVKCEYIDKAVWLQVAAMKDNPDEFRRRYEYAVEGASSSPLNEDLATILREIEKKDKVAGMLRLKWSEAISEGDGDFIAIVETQLKSTMAETKKLRHAADDISAQVGKLKSVANSFARIESKVIESPALMVDATFEQKRDLIDALDIRVDASGKDFRLTITPFVDPALSSCRELRKYKLSRIDLSPLLQTV
jgi:site-specific DNA recombinase